MLLGTCRLQDPNGNELATLVHGNRRIQAIIRAAVALRKLWASPSAKDALRRQNAHLELIRSDLENTKALENYLMEIDVDKPNPEALPNSHKRKEHPESESDSFSVLIRIPQKRWLEQIALQRVEALRYHHYERRTF